MTSSEDVTRFPGQLVYHFFPGGPSSSSSLSHCVVGLILISASWRALSQELTRSVAERFQLPGSLNLSTLSVSEDLRAKTDLLTSGTLKGVSSKAA